MNLAYLRKYPFLGLNIAVVLVTTIVLFVGSVTLKSPFQEFFLILVAAMTLSLVAMFGFYSAKLFSAYIVIIASAVCFSVGASWYGALMGSSISGLSIALHEFLSRLLDRRKEVM